MRRRLMGSETEWGVYQKNDNDSGSAQTSCASFFSFRNLSYSVLDKEFLDYTRERVKFCDKALFSFAGIRNEQTTAVSLRQQLSNGSRFYYDHHTEYATPECDSVFDLVAAEKAGEVVVLSIAPQIQSSSQGKDIVLIKNNIDYHGNTFGAHESYLMPRSVEFSKLRELIVPFLITRQIICGAGSFLSETELGHKQAELLDGYFSLSQRARYIELVESNSTLGSRAVLNTRDEPHSNSSLYRRLHLILGDANMSQYSLALKFGTTHLVLRMIEEKEAPPLGEPLNADKETYRVSLNPFSHRLQFSSGTSLSPLEVQELYCDLATKFFQGEDKETDWILNTWRHFIQGIREYNENPFALFGLSDWVTKLFILQERINAERLNPTNEEHRLLLRSSDQEYHNVTYSKDSLGYNSMALACNLEQLVSEDDILSFVFSPSINTRAYLRHIAMTLFGKDIKEIDWSLIKFSGDKLLPMDRILFLPDDAQDILGKDLKLNDFIDYVRRLNNS